MRRVCISLKNMTSATAYYSLLNHSGAAACDNHPSTNYVVRLRVTVSGTFPSWHWARCGWGTSWTDHIYCLYIVLHIYIHNAHHIYENCLKKRKVGLFVSFPAINHSVDLKDPGGCKPHFNGLLT